MVMVIRASRYISLSIHSRNFWPNSISTLKEFRASCALCTHYSHTPWCKYVQTVNSIKCDVYHSRCVCLCVCIHWWQTLNAPSHAFLNSFDASTTISLCRIALNMHIHTHTLIFGMFSNTFYPIIVAFVLAQLVFCSICIFFCRLLHAFPCIEAQMKK